MINPFEKFTNPGKYVQKVDIKKVVAAPKHYRKGVDKYKEIISSGKQVKPIIILKHPQEDLYAVLDGHHRFYAFLELGFADIEAVIVRSNKLLFRITKNGLLQPTPRMTRFIHIPLIVFSRYVNSFMKTPYKLLKSSRGVVGKIRPKLSIRRKKTEKTNS